MHRCGLMGNAKTALTVRGVALKLAFWFWTGVRTQQGTLQYPLMCIHALGLIVFVGKSDLWLTPAVNRL